MKTAIAPSMRMATGNDFFSCPLKPGYYIPALGSFDDVRDLGAHHIARLAVAAAQCAHTAISFAAQVLLKTKECRLLASEMRVWTLVHHSTGEAIHCKRKRSHYRLRVRPLRTLS